MTLRRVVFDIECNGLTPDKIWVIYCEDLDTGEGFTFLPEENPLDKERFIEFAKTVALWIGHYCLSFDLPVLHRLLPGLSIPDCDVIDTIVVSRLIEFSRKGGHSLEQFGSEFGIEKRQIAAWDEWNPEFIPRCQTDVQITKKVYEKYLRYIDAPSWAAALSLEHSIARVCHDISLVGFSFNLGEAKKLLSRIQEEVATLEASFQVEFPKKTLLVKTVVPKKTKDGKISKVGLGGLSPLQLQQALAGQTVEVYEDQEFNPGSPRQRIDRLWEAGWKPVDKTDGHKAYLGSGGKDEKKLAHFRRYGWKTNEDNLSTLPRTAPKAILSLTRWLLLSSRISRLEEWISHCTSVSGRNGETLDTRIHGEIAGIGAWTQRMAHSKPNLGNIPAFNQTEPEKTPYSDKMRGLWQAGPGKVLVGVDAEGIQLRILAHYMKDQPFIDALMNGRKEDGTDPHALNKEALGRVCKSRDDAKTWVYAWLLGAGKRKQAAILGCSVAEATKAEQNLLDKYQGLRYIKEKVLPLDAVRGYFQGLDGRFVPIPGETPDERLHLALAGYLQNGEAIVVKRAGLMALKRFKRDRDVIQLINIVHDEYVFEVEPEYADWTKRVVMDCIVRVGLELNLACPLSGTGKIGKTWYDVH